MARAKDDYAHFRASSEQLVKQYDTYQPFPDVHVSGKQTSSENIADVAGLNAAYDAYRRSRWRVHFGGRIAAAGDPPGNRNSRKPRSAPATRAAS